MSRQRINKFLQLALFAVVAFVVVNFTTITAFASGKGTETEPYTNIDDLITNNYSSVLRAEMVARNTALDPVYFEYIGTATDYGTDNLEEVVVSVYDSALEYTGQPDEGDYIRQNLDKIYAYSFSGGTGTYIDQEHVRWSYTITFCPTYRSTATQEEAVDDALTAAIASLDLNGKSEYDKAKAVHDYVCGHVTYDNSLTKYATYNAVVEGTSVCQGYSSMLYNMMLRAGIDCRVITGTADNGNGAGGHAWDIVKIDGAWYQIDPTWDDPVGATPTIRYDYFLLSDATIESNHTRGDGTNDKGKKVGIDYTHGSDFEKDYPVSPIDYDALLGCEASVNESIMMYYLLDIPASVYADPDAKISVTFPNDGDQYGTFSYVMNVSEGTATTEGGKACYKYPCIIPSPRMTDMIQIQVSSGDFKSKVYELSFKQYAMALLNILAQGANNDVKITYVKAMLNFGAYAQKYFRYETGNLANADITDDVQSLVVSEAMSEIDSRNYNRPFVRPATSQGVSYVGSSLVVNSTISIRHYYKVDDPSDLSKLTFKIGASGETVSGKLKSGTNDTVYVETQALKVIDFTNFIGNVYVYKDGTEVMKFEGSTPSAAFPGYNVYNYLYNYFDGINNGNLPGDSDMANLAKATYLYAYAGNQVYTGSGN